MKQPSESTPNETNGNAPETPVITGGSSPTPTDLGPVEKQKEEQKEDAKNEEQKDDAANENQQKGEKKNKPELSRKDGYFLVT